MGLLDGKAMMYCLTLGDMIVNLGCLKIGLECRAVGLDLKKLECLALELGYFRL